MGEIKPEEENFYISVAVNIVGCTDVMLLRLEKVMYLFCPAPNRLVLEYQVLKNLGRLCHCSHKQCTKPPRNCGIKVNSLPKEQNQVLTHTCFLSIV